MSLFTEKEVAFLRSHFLGRLATCGRNGVPHVVPTGYQFDAASGTFKIGQYPLEGRGQDRLYIRHLTVNPQVAFVVDDVRTEPEWTPRGITIKGTATLHEEGGEALNSRFGPRWVEITPTWVSSWGIDTHPYQPAVPRKA